MLEILKNGSGIHIKEKNKGSFTRWCGGNVTSECILKGKNSSNPKIRKKATFAANARKWKHKEGGSFKGYPSKAAYEVRLEEVAGFLLGGTINGGNPFGNKLVVVKPKKQKPYWVSAKTSLLQPQDLIGKKGLYLIDYFRNKFFSPYSGVVDLSDKNVVLVENNPHPSMILFNEFDEEGNSNTVRKALDFKETTDTLLGNSNIPLKNISTYYGIENGKFKAGPINTFNDSTIIVPNRAKNYGKIKEIILPTEELEEEYLLNRRDYSLRRLEIKDSLASEYVNKYNLRYDVRNPIYQTLFPLKTDKDYFNENIKHRKNLKLQYQLEVNENLGYVDLRRPVGRFVTEAGDTIPILATEINATPKTAFADENGNAIFVSNLNRNIDEVNRYLKKNPMYNILVDNGRFSGYQRRNADYDRYKGFSNLQYTVGVQKNGGKMKKYLLGGGFFKGLGNFINSDAGKALISTGTSLLKTNAENKLLEAEADALKALNEYDWEETMKLIQALNLLEANLMYLQWALAYLSGSTTDLPSLIVAQHLGWKKYSEALTSGLLNLKNKNALIDTLTLTLKSNNWGNTFNGILTQGLGLVGNYLGNKNTQPSV